MSLRYEVVMTVSVDTSANFLEVEDSTEVSNLGVVKEKILDALYDIDELEVEDVDITGRLD